MDTKKFILEVFKSGSTDEYLVRSEFYNSEDLKKILLNVNEKNCHYGLKLNDNDTIIVGMTDVNPDYIVSIFENYKGTRDGSK